MLRTIVCNVQGVLGTHSLAVAVDCVFGQSFIFLFSIPSTTYYGIYSRMKAFLFYLIFAMFVASLSAAPTGDKGALNPVARIKPYPKDTNFDRALFCTVILRGIILPSNAPTSTPSPSASPSCDRRRRCVIT